MGLRRSLFLKMSSCAMLMIFPSTVFAGESSPAAMLYAHGDATLNGSTVPRSSALFSGDLVQTRPDSVANINVTGSTVLILNDSLVEYDGSAVKLEHGGVTISTSKAMAIRAGAVQVSPRSPAALTEFEVRDVDGTVRIAARKGDLTIADGKGETTLAQGQETTRDDAAGQQDAKNKNGKKRAGAGVDTPAAQNGILNHPLAVGIGGAAILGVTAWVLIQSDNPPSPTQ